MYIRKQKYISVTQTPFDRFDWKRHVPVGQKKINNIIQINNDIYL